MSEAKFTPGPWSVFDAREVPKQGHDYYILDDRENYVAAVAIDHLDIEEANANLIAAAPKMYETLEHILLYTEVAFLHDEIEKLLAEARGEEAKK